MIVVAAPRIKWSFTKGAAIPAVQILLNGHFRFAGSAQDCFSVPFVNRPFLWFVTSIFLVTVVAGIVSETAPELYSYDVEC